MNKIRMYILPFGPMMLVWEKGTDVRNVISWGKIQFSVKAKIIDKLY